MVSNIGVPGLILILVIALVMFGPAKLPEIGRAFGQTIKEFKEGAKDVLEQQSEHVTTSDSRTGNNQNHSTE